MFHAVASTTKVSTTKAAKKKYSFAGLSATANAAASRTVELTQNLIGRSSSEQSLGSYSQHDQQQPEGHGGRPGGAEHHQHDRLGNAEDQPGGQGAGHAAQAGQHHHAEGAADVH